MDVESTLKGKLGSQYTKLEKLKNPHVNEFIAKYILHCQPDSVYVFDGSAESVEYFRKKAVEKGEEKPLAMEGHTYHFENYADQGRDTKNTRYLLPEGWDLGKLNSIPKKEGVAEVMGFLKDSMKGREMIVAFFSLGPEDSIFSRSCLQITDSYYVAHSETILYRSGYQNFLKIADKKDFFKFVHTAGELENYVSKNIDKRRIYIDLEENTVYSTNTQYAGNTVGLKKLALRLAINQACHSDWLAEHMFIMASHGPGGRKTYLTGAFPSACGKTSTSMVRGETIVGDDIAYLRIIDGKIRAVNVEKGIFGIIADVNSRDDPVIYETLTSPGEVIFSNVLIDDTETPYWMGKDGECPKKGINHSGQWTPGKKDKDGKEITPSHKNARYTVAISDLKNVDPELDNPEGVEVGGVIYGGRDSDTTVPVEQAFDWVHGIVTKGAAIESETTAATIGQEGVRKINPMSNIEFVAVAIGDYVKANIDFGLNAEKQPMIFSVNYFLKGKDGKYLNGKEDKRVWVKWMELKIHGDVKAIKTPTGYIPHYADLKKLFTEVMKRDYSLEEYNQQFTIRIPELLAKAGRIEKYYKETKNTPEEVFTELTKQKERLLEYQKKHGDYIKPEQLV
ncbi:MAG: phosphoenolpyruvate carboxykinase (GTP) [Candidatus Altiarchaeota archaeon]|nr:phosphoenolpyruvate carboxykinase (GTP) [Candidatus Altiarchaeota archaeon]